LASRQAMSRSLRSMRLGLTKLTSPQLSASLA
jgi:hypothetical protein